MKSDAMKIIRGAIADALPGPLVKKALKHVKFDEGGVLLVSVGKAAWEMASAALDEIDTPLKGGIVITKYGHSRGELAGIEIHEAGHPISDENGYRATERALNMIEGLKPNDTVLFLLSGGGSALFEKPLLPKREFEDISKKLILSGASIGEINAVRKRLSAVKGGKFALNCRPARVYSVILSDVLGDRIDTVASGPACADESDAEEALGVVKRYGLKLSDEALRLLKSDPVRSLDNVQNQVIGSVKQLTQSAARTALLLGYEPHILTDSLSMEARSAGEYLAKVAREHQNTSKSIAFIAGGETVVKVKGNGIGGRNQELALSAAIEMSGFKDTCAFSVGSDGTDGPTDAAGAIVDGKSFEKMMSKGVDACASLENNDSYHALKAIDALVFTGPTGTNVNDLSVILIKR